MQRRPVAVLLSTIELLRERFLTRNLSALHEKGLSLEGYFVPKANGKTASIPDRLVIDARQAR
jgi:hypothetical protein